jgi:hypothetical protein
MPSRGIDCRFTAGIGHSWCVAETEFRSPAAWFADPGGTHRVRYWDVALWTRWVADGADPFQESVPAAAPVFRAGARRYWGEVLIVGAPLFLAGWGGIGLFALTHGGTQVGAFLTIVAAFVAVGVVRQPFVATWRADGTLTFRALTRTITTTADAVTRVGIIRGRGRAYVFSFDDRKAVLAPYGGQALYNDLLAWNPAIQS